jgi:putative aldouronate transport system permease protein
MQRIHRSSSFPRYFSENWSLYLMSLPGLVYLVVYKFLPLIGLSLAFKDYDMFAGTGLLDSMLKSEWVGLGYFRRIFSSPQFWSLLRNTLLISVYKIVILFPLPILLAFLMNELRSVRFKRTVQTLLYLPHFLSWVIIYGIFFTLLSTDGIVNQALARLGLSPVMFFTDQSLFRPLLVVTEGWREAGWGTIVYLAALTSIDPALYEAALMDGANRWQRMVHITFPSILPVVALMLLLRVGNILQAGFEQILVMYNPAVYPVADILQTYIYRIGLGKLDFSTGTAMGMFESVVGFVLVITCNGISRKFFERSLW